MRAYACRGRRRTPRQQLDLLGDVPAPESVPSHRGRSRSAARNRRTAHGGNRADRRGPGEPATEFLTTGWANSPTTFATRSSFTRRPLSKPAVDIRGCERASPIGPWAADSAASGAAGCAMARCKSRRPRPTLAARAQRPAGRNRPGVAHRLGVTHTICTKGQYATPHRRLTIGLRVRTVLVAVPSPTHRIPGASMATDRCVGPWSN
jgi:hypothetical protein